MQDIVLISIPETKIRRIVEDAINKALDKFQQLEPKEEHQPTTVNLPKEFTIRKGGQNG